ncbi:hypothetical protein PIB30_003791 [Stylosanthes scabra]|uniref:Ubiquitin-like domain-containing protein n=1 Tax=Stylosanthes scabra TaxID=79078 RepID=A0ABU6S3H4_9FABA|nr:hypothetical protein [Stylosanthes scabra]
MSVSSSSGGANRRNDASDDDGVERITISITGQNDRRLLYKVNPNKSLASAFQNYCIRSGLDYSTIQFIFNGNRVHGKDTAKKLKLKEGDEIFAAKHVHGGGVATLSFSPGWH